MYGSSRMQLLMSTERRPVRPMAIMPPKTTNGALLGFEATIGGLSGDDDELALHQADELLRGVEVGAVVVVEHGLHLAVI